MSSPIHQPLSLDYLLPWTANQCNNPLASGLSVQPVLPPVSLAGEFRDHDIADDDGEVHGHEAKISKSSLKRKKFDACFVCQSRDKVLSYEDAL